MRVLDLFAGSGALAFEALSRGAAAATLVESDHAAAAQLRATAARFGLTGERVENSDALAMLRAAAAGSYDLVLLDPPFDSALLAPALTLLGQRSILAAGGFCYVETPAGAPLPALPEGWLPHRAGKAGEVGYHLLHAPPSPLPRNL